MTEFGRRETDHLPRFATAHAAAGPRPDIGGALATGDQDHLPVWTSIGPIKMVLCVLFFSAACYVFVADYLPELARDMRLAGTWRVAPELRVSEGQCTRRAFTITMCKAKIHSSNTPDQPPVTSEFMLLFASGSGEPLVPVRSTKDPAAMGIAYSVDTMLINRIAGLSGILLILLASVAAAAAALIGGYYKGGRAHKALLAGLEELEATTHSEPRYKRS